MAGRDNWRELSFKGRSAVMTAQRPAAQLGPAVVEVHRPGGHPRARCDHADRGREGDRLPQDRGVGRGAVLSAGIGGRGGVRIYKVIERYLRYSGYPKAAAKILASPLSPSGPS